MFVNIWFGIDVIYYFNYFLIDFNFCEFLVVVIGGFFFVIIFKIENDLCVFECYVIKFVFVFFGFLFVFWFFFKGFDIKVEWEN